VGTGVGAGVGQGIVLITNVAHVTVASLQHADVTADVAVVPLGTVAIKSKYLPEAHPPPPIAAMLVEEAQYSVLMSQQRPLCPSAPILSAFSEVPGT